MKYTIDSGVGIKFVIPEINSDKAIRLVQECQKGIHELISPDMFPTEVCNGLMMAERRGRIPAGMADTFFQEVLKVLPALHPATPLLPRALEIAKQFRQTVYDSLYASLAEREGCEFVSADDKFVNAVKAKLPFVISLSSLP
jgi:predicted nucleic acid-binding protein